MILQFSSVASTRRTSKPSLSALRIFVRVLDENAAMIASSSPEMSRMIVETFGSTCAVGT